MSTIERILIITLIALLVLMFWPLKARSGQLPPLPPLPLGAEKFSIQEHKRLEAERMAALKLRERETWEANQQLESWRKSPEGKAQIKASKERIAKRKRDDAMQRLLHQYQQRAKIK